MKTKTYLFLLIFLIISACNTSTDFSKESNKQVSTQATLDSLINYENSKNKSKESNIYTHSRLTPDNNSEFDRYPTVDTANTSPHSLVLSYLWQPNSLDHYKIFIEIPDTNAIELDKVYELPNQHIKIKTVYYGMFSNFELLKNIKGTILFNTLQSDYSTLQLNLIGDLSKMVRRKGATIINQKLNIIKEYSCYQGYAPENKLGVNLDSIRELESAKNNDYNQTDLIPKGKLTFGTHEVGVSGDYLRIEKDSTLDHSLVLSNSWRPNESNAHHRRICIEIFDTSTIELETNYSIPNDLFQIQGIIYGHMHGASR